MTDIRELIWGRRTRAHLDAPNHRLTSLFNMDVPNSDVRLAFAPVLVESFELADIDPEEPLRMAKVHVLGLGDIDTGR